MSASDIIFIAVIIFAFAIGFFVVNYVADNIVDDMLAVPMINASNQTSTAINTVKDTAGRLDYVIFGVFIAFILGIIITSWFIGGNPLFMFLYFIVWIIGVVISTILANTWETVTNMVVFGTTIIDFPLTNNILLNLPIYIGVIGFVGFVIMFAKPYMRGE